MNFMNRAWLYIIRKKGKSILLFIILLVMATFVLTALALGNASKSAQEDLRKSLGGSFLIGFDYTENNPYLKVENVEGGTLMYSTQQISPELVEQIRGIGGVTDCSATVEGLAAFPSLELFTGNIPIEEEFRESSKILSTWKSEELTRFTSGQLTLTEGRHIIPGDKNKGLRGVNAQMETGEMYAILGSSGCGKTTLLSLIGGLDSPTSGSINFNGKDISQIGLENHRKKNIAFIFQSYNLIDYMTPQENVWLTGKKPVLSILERLGLTREEAKRNVLKLSGGQQQRVAIARALASEAPVILADEPTGNLDEDTARGIIELLKKTAHELGKCVIVVTHSKQLAEEADEVLEIQQGKLRKREGTK